MVEEQYSWNPVNRQKVLVAQLYLTFCNPIDCRPPGASVRGILQARILEQVAIPFSRGIFLIQGLSLGLLHCRQILYCVSLQRNLKKRRSERGGQQGPDHVGLYSYDKDLILGVIGSHWGGFENDRAQLLGVRLWTGVRGKLRLFFGNGVKPKY